MHDEAIQGQMFGLAVNLECSAVATTRVSLLGSGFQKHSSPSDWSDALVSR